MPTTTKTHTGPTKASKYPYRYQQDVKDRNDFRMKMKAELKAMARESFLEEMEKVRILKVSGNASGIMDSSSFEVTPNNMSRFQRIVEDLQNRNNGNSNMQLEWSSPAVRLQIHNNNNQSDAAADLGILTARTDPGTQSMMATRDMSPAQHTRKKKAPGSASQKPAMANNPSIPVNQMFVLSSAPILSHEKLVHEQIHNGSTKLDSSSLLEQANRYTELQSLFQPPIMTKELFFDENNNSLFPQEGEYDEEEEEAELRRQQRRLEQREKLEATINHHKERLNRSRQEERFYHSGLLAKSAQSAKPTAPRAYANNRGRRIVDKNSHQQQQGHTPYSPSSQHHNYHHHQHGSRSNSPSHNYHNNQHTPYDPNYPYPPMDAHGRPNTSHFNPSSPSVQHHHMYSNRSNHSLLTTESSIMDATQPAKHYSGQSHVNSVSHNQGLVPQMSVGSIAAPTPAMLQLQQSHSNINNTMMSTNASVMSGTLGVGAGSYLAPSVMSSSQIPVNGHLFDQTNVTNVHISPGNDSDRMTAETSVMSVEEFQKKTERMDEDLRKVVRDVVHTQMEQDGRAQHYTKRFMNKMMKEKETPLVDRIEKAVGDKIVSLQKELDALKAKKLRRFKRKNKRGLSRGTPASTTGGDNSSAADEEGSFFGGYYDIDDDELPGWLKNSGEILHVLEKTQMNTGDSSDPHHIDVRTLNSEINRAIEITLRRILTGQQVDYHVHPGQHLDPNASGTNSLAASEKANLLGVDMPSKSMKSGKNNGASINAAALTSKVHGRIDAGKDPSKNGDTYGDFDKAPLVPLSADVPAAVSVKAKKKSKAEKLLGISDGPGAGKAGGEGGGGGMNNNNGFGNNLIDPSSASARPGGSLFGQLGNLFSSKPGASNISPSMSSTKPSMMMSMMSSRDSVNSNTSSIHANPPVVNNSVRPGRQVMAPIIDEGDEETSHKSSPNKGRPGSRGAAGNGSDSAKKPNKLSSNNSLGSQKKKKKAGTNNSGDDANGSRSRSNSLNSLQSANANKGNVDGTNAAGGLENDPENGQNANSNSNNASSPAKRKVPMNPLLVAELTREESKYRELMQNLLSLADVKVSIKRELKEWERQFTMKTGREASADDKATINDRYIAYKLASTQVQEAKDHVRACEDKLKEIRERAASEQEYSIQNASLQAE